MPAKDIYHDAVKNALMKDGWGNSELRTQNSELNMVC